MSQSIALQIKNEFQMNWDKSSIVGLKLCGWFLGLSALTYVTGLGSPIIIMFFPLLFLLPLFIMGVTAVGTLIYTIHRFSLLGGVGLSLFLLFGFVGMTYIYYWNYLPSCQGFWSCYFQVFF